MVSNYNTSVASKDSNFSHGTLFSEYSRAINNEVPVNKARRHILLRSYARNGLGVMLAVINVQAKNGSS